MHNCYIGFYYFCIGQLLEKQYSNLDGIENKLIGYSGKEARV